MRLAVIGTSGSGKSTLARSVSGRLGIQHIEQDEHAWGPHWQMVPRPQFLAAITHAVALPAWTICGNYTVTQEVIWNRATHVVWLRYPMWRCLIQAFCRCLRRVFLREPCCNGNRETFAHAFLSKHSILVWIWKTHRRKEADYLSARASHKFDHAEWLEFRSPGQAERWLKTLAP